MVTRSRDWLYGCQRGGIGESSENTDLGLCGGGNTWLRLGQTQHRPSHRVIDDLTPFRYSLTVSRGMVSCRDDKDLLDE
jgi:hypothetical protein